MDTLINFASAVRDNSAVGNAVNPLLHFFPNVFRGAERLSGIFSHSASLSKLPIIQKSNLF